MANISNDFFISNYSLNSYEDALKTYEWIKDALLYAFVNEKNIHVEIRARFTCFETNYTCESINEFKRLAFGKKINMGNLYVSAQIDSEPFVLASVFLAKNDYEDKQKVSISSYDELFVANIKEALMSEKCKQKEVCKVIDNSVRIGDNVTIYDSNIANIESTIFQEKNTTSSEKWYKKIVWEIVAPIIVGVVVAVVIALLNLK